MADTSSLVKTILHNSIAEGLYDEIVNKNSRYYYFLGKTLSWDDEFNPPSPIDSFDYELKTRNEIITLKEIKPTDVAFVVPRYNWVSSSVYDMYDDQYSKEVQGINLIDGGVGYAVAPIVYIGSAGSVTWTPSTAVSKGSFLRVASGSTYRYYICSTAGVTATTAPTHTTGTYSNGTASLTHYNVSDAGGSGASAVTYILDGQVVDITLTSRGNGYVTPPSVIIASIGNGGISAYAEAVVNISASGHQKIEDCNYYVLTDEYNVYKCLDNNNGALSTYKPIGTTVDPTQYPDGYVWKFLFTVPVALRNKFLNDEYIPVITALRNQFYSNGNLQTIRVDQAGSGYTLGSITVQGDGYLEANPYYINANTLVSGGTSYQSTSSITVSSPYSNISSWVSTTLLLAGQKLSYNNNIYEVAISGTSSSVAPSHTSGIVANGTSALKFVGTTITGDITVTSGVITDSIFYSSLRDILISSFGYGYNSIPSITISAPTFTVSSVSTPTEVITLTSMHPLQTGQIVNYSSGGTAIGGLTNGLAYYVIRDTNKTIKLATTYANAIAGTAINLTSSGSGTHRFTYESGRATATAVMTGGHLVRTVITAEGSGYTTIPTVVFGTEWASTTALTLNQQVFYSNRLYTVTTAGTTSSTAPVHITGSATNGTVTLQYVGSPITGTALMKYGSGYSSIPTVNINSLTGSGGSLTLSGVKSEAKLTPIFEGGQLTSVQIDDGGVGYSYASLTVNGDGSSATISADLSPGDINTLQANVELLTVDGKVFVADIISGGYGYAAATVTVDGDGTGATATAVLENGRVKKIHITNYGSGYRWATITISGNGYGAKARAIISPYGGHGKNSVNDLYARTLMFYSNISSDKNQGFIVNNDYRQSGIIKNPSQYNSTYAVTNIIASACWVISGSISTTFFPVDSIITVANSTKRFRIVTNTGTGILAQSLDNYVPIIGTTFVNSGGNTFSASAVTSPTIDKYSGDLLFIDNKQGFTPTADQSVTLRTIIKF